MSWNPRDWRIHHRLMHQQAADLYGLTERGWQETESLWKNKARLKTSRLRTEYACKFMDIMMAENHQQAIDIAMDYYNSHKKIK